VDPKNYPEGKPVRIYHSPRDPWVACLEPGINNEVWYLPGAGAAFLLFGLAAWKWAVPALTRW